MKIQSLNAFKGQSMEKEALNSLYGGYCCSTGAGSNSEAGISWSGDTNYYNDQTGAFEKSTKHQGASDQSKCNDNG